MAVSWAGSGAGMTEQSAGRKDPLTQEGPDWPVDQPPPEQRPGAVQTGTPEQDEQVPQNPGDGTGPHETAGPG